MALSHYTKSALRQAARGELVKGALWLVLAVAVGAATFLLDWRGRGYVLWGALLYGGYRLVRGVYYYIYPEALLKR